MSKLPPFIGILFVNIILTINIKPVVSNKNNFHELNDTDYRLPKNVIPEEYKLLLKPTLNRPISKNLTFNGNVEIKVRVNTTINKIVLHRGKSLVLNKYAITNDKRKLLKIDSVTYDENSEKQIFVLNDDVIIHSIIYINISFSGFLSKIPKGFYVGSVVPTDDTNIYVATNFQSTFARSAFPCFDEPQYKSKFTIEIQRPKTFTSISNMPLNLSASIGNNMHADIFQTSMPIPTYQVSFFVSDFEYLSEPRGDLKIRINAHAINQTFYALEIARKARSDLSGFFKNFNTMLSKVDMIAIPNISPAEATAKVGYMTFDENNLLYYSDYTSDVDKTKIATTIVHKWANMCANLVTPTWWDSRWINEAFSLWMKHFRMEQSIEPNWLMGIQFIPDHKRPALIADAANLLKPLQQPVRTTGEIENSQDDIIYSKSASILQVLYTVVLYKNFYAGWRDYFKTKIHQTATADDFWSSFQRQVNSSQIKLPMDVKSIMHSWTNQSGFPLISATRKNKTITLHQQQFTHKLHNSNSHSINSRWCIPLTWVTQKKLDFETDQKPHLFNKTNDQLKLDIADNEWVIFNRRGLGYYRVNYDKDSWLRIISTLKSNDFDSIHRYNRATLLDDLLNLAKYGHIEYATALSAVEYLPRETMYEPWKVTLDNLELIYTKILDPNLLETFNTYIWQLIKPAYEKLGIHENKNDQHLTKLLRLSIIEWACKIENHNCIQNLLQVFNSWTSNSTNLVPRNLRKIVYCTAVKFGPMHNWDYLWDKYLSTNILCEKTAIIEALACTNDHKNAEKLLKYIFNRNSGIRFQDSLSTLTSLYSSSAFGLSEVLNYMKKHPADVVNHYQDKKIIKRIIKTMASHVATPELLKQLEELLLHDRHFAPHREFSESRITQSYGELEWMKTYSPILLKVLSKDKYHEDTTNFRGIYPVAYRINLTIDSENNTSFNGAVQIKLNVTKAVTKIVLQAIQLNISNIKIIYSNATIQNNVMSARFNDKNKLIIYLNQNTAVGSQFTLLIKYAGSINNESSSFYRQLYKNTMNKNYSILGTQFQKYDPGWLFPYFPEHDFKSTFQFNILRPNHFHTLSNMIWVKSMAAVGSNGTWDYFNETDIISPHDISFIITDFGSSININSTNDNGTSSIGLQNIQNALQSARNMLNFLKKYTEISNPIGNVSYAFVPNVISDQVKTWNFITFNESQIFFDQSIAPTHLIRDTDIELANKVANMWFTKLAASELSENIWLNDGLSEYFKWMLMNELHPDLKLMEQFIVYEMQPALLTESTANVLPMSQNKSTQKMSHEELRYTANYGKFAGLVYMIHQLYGTEQFRKVLQKYLVDSAHHQTVTTADLWLAIDDRVIKSINESNFYGAKPENGLISAIRTWTEQAGYPVVHASKNGTSLVLHQERFLITGKNKTFNELYSIPITIATKLQNEMNFSNIFVSTWLETPDSVVPIILQNTTEWFILNIQQVGFYRVDYDAENWKKLTEALYSEDFGGIHVINRAQIIDDLYNLARANYLSYNLTFNATKYLVKETNHLPWKAFFNGIAYLYERFDGQSVQDQLKLYLLTLIKPIYEAIGFEENESESQMNKLNRQLIVSWACEIGYPACIQSSVKLFNEWRDVGKVILPDVKQTVLCSAIRYGNDTDWEFLWKKYHETTVESEKMIILNSLGCSQNITTINNYLHSAIASDSLLGDHHIPVAFSSVYSTGKFGVNATMEFLYNNYKDMHKIFGNWDLTAELFVNAASKISMENQRIRLQQFINKNKSVLVHMNPNLIESLSFVEKNIAWYNNHVYEIEDWLMDNWNFTITENIKQIMFTTVMPIDGITMNRSLKQIYSMLGIAAATVVILVISIIICCCCCWSKEKPASSYTLNY